MSYVGLWSYYNFDNWTYQPSYVSSNTPWFFNGMRVRSSRATSSRSSRGSSTAGSRTASSTRRRASGVQVLWRPNGALSFLSNNYYGHDTLGHPGSQAHPHRRQHPGQVLRRPEGRVRQGRVLAHGRRRLRGRRRRELHRRHAAQPSQYFLGFMAYNRMLVPQRPLRPDARRRRDQQPRPLPRAAAADQRRDRVLGHAVLHREPGRPVQGVGRVADVRLHARPSSSRSAPSSTTAPRACRTSRAQAASRRPAATRVRPGSLVPDWTPDLRKTENRLNFALLVKNVSDGEAPDNAASQSRSPRHQLTS